MADTSKTMVVIPTYNERENIEHLIRAILILHPEFFVTLMTIILPDEQESLPKNLPIDYPQYR